MAMRGQTFTLEGVAASLLLIIATYTVFQSSVVVSPSWSEFNNVQLKQIAYDILRIADNDSSPNSWKWALMNFTTGANCTTDKSLCDLSRAAPDLEANLSEIIRERIGADARLEVIWLNNTHGGFNVTVIEPFDKRPTPNAVRASRFIYLGDVSGSNTIFSKSVYKNSLLVEVRLTLWKV